MCIGTQSKSFRYENGFGGEIGVKFNRNNDIILIIEELKGNKFEFVFASEDDQTLNYLDIILTNLIAYYNTFDFNYGRKINESKLAMEFRVRNENGSILEMGAYGEAGICFTIINKDSKEAKILFTQDDKTVLESFKVDLSNVIKKNIAKLPPVTINVAGSNEAPHSYKEIK